MQNEMTAPADRRTPKRLTVTARAILPEGEKLIKVTGQVARTLTALVEAGDGGVSTLEAINDGLSYRFSAYAQVLRKGHGLIISAEREGHAPASGGSGWHARYRLACPVELVEIIRPEGRAHV